MKQTVYTASPESHVKFTSEPEPRRDADAGAGRGCAWPKFSRMVVSPINATYVGVRPSFVSRVSYCADDGALTFAAESALPGSSGPALLTGSSWSFCLCRIV